MHLHASDCNRLPCSRLSGVFALPLTYGATAVYLRSHQTHGLPGTCGSGQRWANWLFFQGHLCLPAIVLQLQRGDEEKGVIYVCSDNNKCFGCGGADTLLCPVESSETQRVCYFVETLTRNG